MQPANTDHSKTPYSLGLPMWNNRHWAGSVFAAGTSSQSSLRSYSRVFHCVEGNTTFYALPGENTVSSWKEQVSDGFRFCFKLPRNITHQASRRLCDNPEELTLFFRRLEPLADVSGPFMIQLPERFDPGCLDQLKRLIRLLPEDFSFAVEVRHPGFFDRSEQERSLNQLLHKHNINRVCFDSRALFSRPAVTEQEHDAHKKKPRLPVHAINTATQPIVRFIGSSDMTHNTQYLLPWVKKLKQWCSEGLRPFFFIHTPDNIKAPQQAFAFHQQLMAIPAWQPLSRELKDENQLTIF